jgi:1-acyl-sn-glycerol-3-phosphate acyltransferase
LIFLVSLNPEEPPKNRFTGLYSDWLSFPGGFKVLTTMIFQDPLSFSSLLLDSFGTKFQIAHSSRIPEDKTILVFSNHRSFMDAPLLMASLGQPIRFACHHYMSQVPILREVVQALGCFSMDASNQSQQVFFKQATRLLKSHQVIGIFPEGSQSMVQRTVPYKVEKFHRGFAHLALRSLVPNLAILPVAIVSQKESVYPGIPLPIFHFFDPSEPLFDQMGLHPLVVYHKVKILIGHPYLITSVHQEQYRGKQCRKVVDQLTQYCQGEITHLLIIR